MIKLFYHMGVIYKFKIFGAPPSKDYIEIEVAKNETVLDIKKKIIKKIGLNINPEDLKFIKV